jgi:hypothetical protein
MTAAVQATGAQGNVLPQAQQAASAAVDQGKSQLGSLLSNLGSGIKETGKEMFGDWTKWGTPEQNKKSLDQLQSLSGQQQQASQRADQERMEARRLLEQQMLMQQQNFWGKLGGYGPR